MKKIILALLLTFAIATQAFAGGIYLYRPDGTFVKTLYSNAVVSVVKLDFDDMRVYAWLRVQYGEPPAYTYYLYLARFSFSSPTTLTLVDLSSPPLDGNTYEAKGLTVDSTGEGLKYGDKKLFACVYITSLPPVEYLIQYNKFNYSSYDAQSIGVVNYSAFEFDGQSLLAVNLNTNPDTLVSVSVVGKTYYFSNVATLPSNGYTDMDANGFDLWLCRTDTLEKVSYEGELRDSINISGILAIADTKFGLLVGT